MITKFGKRFLTNYLAGNILFTQKEIALGIGSTAVNSKGNDTRLEFEFYRLPVTLGSIDVTQTGTDIDGDPIFSYTAIFKGTIPQDIAGVINEVGLYPSTRSSTNNYDSKFITSFENNLSWLDSSNGSPALKLNDSATSFYAKIGENMVQFIVPSSTTKEYKNTILSLDLSGYSANDSLSIAYKKADNNTSQIRVKLYSSDTSYYYADFTPSGINGDKIQSVSMNTVFTNAVNSPDPTNITKVGIAVTAGAGGTTNMYFDGLRINDEDTFDPQYGLISRSVFSSGNELVKPSGRAVDIEYKLQLGF
jgi:hypothetical protein